MAKRASPKTAETAAGTITDTATATATASIAARATATLANRPPPAAAPAPQQVVLVLQGGGALGAYQAGVYEALHEAGMEPDWVIGTSIGAINGALIAGNLPALRLQRLRDFWHTVAFKGLIAHWPEPPGQPTAWTSLSAMAQGIPGFFRPNPPAWLSPRLPLDESAAGYYLTDELRQTLTELTDAAVLDSGAPRLTVGAVRVVTGQMHYFDSRDAPLGLQQVLASGALPPAFPPVRVGEHLYWDGGIYSNTPIEAVFDDRPRCSALLFSVHLWRPEGELPQTMAEVNTRYKDIQYASRAESHVRRQAQIHHLRHIVRELADALPADARARPEMQRLAGWGCRTVMHLMNLVAPRLPDEDGSKDLDFNARRIAARWQAGLDDTRQTLARRPWLDPFDPELGLVVHETNHPLTTPAVDAIAGIAPTAAGQRKRTVKR